VKVKSKFSSGLVHLHNDDRPLMCTTIYSYVIYSNLPAYVIKVCYHLSQVMWVRMKPVCRFVSVLGPV